MAVKNKKIIGLTGVYCAGKNHVALLLEKRGFPVLDLDKLGHEVIETEKERLLSRFGNDILGENGLVNRKHLGARVFGNRTELAALEEIIHPGVNRATLSWIDSQKEEICFINAALLHRSSAFEILDAVIIVEAPFLHRFIRAKKRDRLPFSVLIKRFQSQREFNSQYFREKTDIYRVGNPSGCIISRQKKLESRINEILSLLGIKQV